MAETALDRLHRDAYGNGLLVGPNCSDCNRRHLAVYRCVRCGYRIEVPGMFRWYWQGRGHYHEADDPKWGTALTGHLADVHDGDGGFLPVRDDEPEPAARPTGGQG